MNTLKIIILISILFSIYEKIDNNYHNQKYHDDYSRMSVSDIIETWISDGKSALSQREIDILMKTAEPIKLNTPIYRGINLTDNQYLKPHDKLTSWTVDPVVAENFGNIVLEWKPEKPILGIDLTNINYSEKEIIVCFK